ncbi:MAG: short-chain dehydrogenase/reductase [Pseudohongiella sp.]|nr:MAG: short-chain dehydrogenase/reductase [Pseudohongiella sp.]
MGKVALVTGTSTGVGLHLAVLLAKQGYTTYATMRNLDKKEALLSLAEDASVEVLLKELDVQDSENIQRCVDEIIAEAGAIDLLVNNAGAGFVRTTEQATEEEIDWVLDVNYVGVIRCTKAVLGHMREKRSGHIINVTSVGGLVGQPFNEFYCGAKFAVEGYTESLASYVQPKFNVKFSCVEPGGIATEFATNALTQFQAGGGMTDDEYKPLLEQYIGAAQARAAQGDTGVFQSAEQVAQVIVDCANNPEPPIRVRTSDWAENFCALKTDLDPDGKKLQAYVLENVLGG